MMGSSAQLEILPDASEAETGAAAGLRREAAERLAAHRMRRARAAAEVTPQEQREGKRGAVAAAVAERYAQTPSFRAVLAEEAKRAIEQAEAAAEVARVNAEAVASAQAAVLAELEKWVEPVTFSAASAEIVAQAPPPPALPPEAGVVKEVSAGGLTVRLYEDVGPTAKLPARRSTSASAPSADEARALDAEIAFRQAPVFDALPPEEPATPLAANLLEFPRQLVAAKKNRPRLAEMPLILEEAARNPQLRIFEVEPVTPAVPEPVAYAPDWSRQIWLDAHTVTEPEAVPDDLILASLLPPQVAPMGMRLMAASVDALLVAAGFIAFSAAAARVAGVVPTGKEAGLVAAGALILLYFVYQALFFTLSDHTPGMRYARIGLCTFSDENPSRSAMRKRILAQVVSACPLGLGVLWVLLDDDRLGWTDRISRMYQRAY